MKLWQTSFFIIIPLLSVSAFAKIHEHYSLTKKFTCGILGGENTYLLTGMTSKGQQWKDLGNGVMESIDGELEEEHFIISKSEIGINPKWAMLTDPHSDLFIDSLPSVLATDGKQVIKWGIVSKKVEATLDLGEVSPYFLEKTKIESNQSMLLIEHDQEFLIVNASKLKILGKIQKNTLPQNPIFLAVSALGEVALLTERNELLVFDEKGELINRGNSGNYVIQATPEPPSSLFGKFAMYKEDYKQFQSWEQNYANLTDAKQVSSIGFYGGQDDVRAVLLHLNDGNLAVAVFPRTK